MPGLVLVGSLALLSEPRLSTWRRRRDRGESRRLQIGQAGKRRVEDRLKVVRVACVTADQLSATFGVAKSTMSSKARQVRDLLRISHFSPEFQRADVAVQNPLAWIIDVNGLAVDARHVPPDIQAEAFRRGFIPYIPVLGRTRRRLARNPR